MANLARDLRADRFRQWNLEDRGFPAFPVDCSGTARCRSALLRVSGVVFIFASVQHDFQGPSRVQGRSPAQQYWVGTWILYGDGTGPLPYQIAISVLYCTVR